MRFRIKAYLKFLYQSTNQHGVHSPFVYDLVTKCFYSSKNKVVFATIKSIYKKANINYYTAKLINRIPPHFGFKNALILTEPSDSIAKVLSTNNIVSIDTAIQSKRYYDIVYIAISQLQYELNIESLLSMMHNDSILIINSISKSKMNTTMWEEVKEHPKVTVTIDTFYMGYVFIRNEQAKEHFTIRA